MAPHKGRGILFGGVFDQEESEEDLSSIFYNDLYLPHVLLSKLDTPIKLRITDISS
jgi:hypothetical protein